ncbi:MULTISPECIES: hypothetical protein [Sutcliffiella]|uniref:hypothetical protein n=1 Tax=Sutcliffiella TaxID=2837511 RepID=UPI001F184394|nr:hypothetical protein [Sutcliffiella horikoshii]
MKKRLKAKLEKRQALFKSQSEHRAIGHTNRLVASRQRAQSNTHRPTPKEQQQ